MTLKISSGRKESKLHAINAAQAGGPNEAPSENLDLPWLAALSALAKGSRVVLAIDLPRLIDAAASRGRGVAWRLKRLCENPEEVLVLGALYAEGIDWGCRGALRQRFQPASLSTDALEAQALVRWISGELKSRESPLAACLHPQGRLCSAMLINRDGAHAPLDGRVRLSPWISGILYPGVEDALGNRRIDASLRLSRPSKGLDSLVLSTELRTSLVGFKKLVCSRQGPGRSALFWGKAGLGKTMAARALAHEVGMPLLSVNISDVRSAVDLLGGAFSAARIEGALLFIDECARFVSEDRHGLGPDAAAATLLQELQDAPVPVIAAMNQGWLSLSSAFQRRFQFQACFKQPDAEARFALWRMHLASPAADSDLRHVASFYDLSGGLIKNAAARVDAESGGPASRAMLEVAAVSQLESQLDWESPVPGTFSMRLLRSALSHIQRRRLTALGGRTAAVKNLLGRQLSLPEGYKALLHNRSRTSLELAASWVARVAGLNLLIKELEDIEDMDDDFASRRVVPRLRGPLEAAVQSGCLPALVVREWQFEKGQVPLLVRQFLSFRGPGLLLYASENRERPTLDPLPAEYITLGSKGQLSLKGFDALASGITIEEAAINYVEEHARDFEEAAQILRAALVQTSARGLKHMGMNTAKEARELYMQGIQGSGEMLFAAKGGR